MVTKVMVTMYFLIQAEYIVIGRRIVSDHAVKHTRILDITVTGLDGRCASQGFVGFWWARVGKYD